MTNKSAQNTRAQGLLFWSTAFALLFIHLGTTATWQSEDRWLEIAREMLLSGNYFKPTLNGQLYFDKPLLGYWLVIACKFLIGGLNEWSLRLPSVIAGLITLWATIDLAKQLWNKEIACKAGWILLTSFGFLQWARLGEADMENLAASTLAVSWYWRHRNHTSVISYSVFYAIIAIGAQCKGLTAFVVPMLALLPDLVATRRFRQQFNARHVIAILIGGTIYFLPYLLSREGFHTNANATLPNSGLALVLRENIVRYFAPFDHTEPPYTYLIAIPQYLFPWCFIFIFSLCQTLRRQGETFVHRNWLLWTIGLIFLFFTLSGSRRNYYILPILPYCALLTANYLHNQPARAALKITITLLAIIGGIYVATFPLWPLLQQRAHDTLPDNLRWHTAITGTAILCSLVATLWYGRLHRFQLLHACLVGSVIWLAGFFFFTQLTIDHFRSESDFGRRLKIMLADHPNAVVATYRERPGGDLLFYADLKPNVVVLKTPTDLRDFIDNTNPEKALLIYHRYDNEIPYQLLNRRPQLEEEQFWWEKNNKEKMQAWLFPH